MLTQQPSVFLCVAVLLRAASFMSDALHATPCRQELEAAQQQVVELLGRVKGIQSKAEESETMVQEICK